MILNLFKFVTQFLRKGFANKNKNVVYTIFEIKQFVDCHDVPLVVIEIINNKGKTHTAMQSIGPQTKYSESLLRNCATMK